MITTRILALSVFTNCTFVSAIAVQGLAWQYLLIRVLLLPNKYFFAIPYR
jgi:hypothetical protein